MRSSAIFRVRWVCRELARFGTRGYVDGAGKRLSIKDINVTPNHHAMAASGPSATTSTPIATSASTDTTGWWASYPNAWTESR